jgi:hypothetical protein
MWLVNGLASFTSADTGPADSAKTSKLVEMILFMGFLIVIAVRLPQPVAPVKAI